MRLFVTGIGTDVGKTLAAAVLTEALQADYWKPVQSGNIQSEDAQTVRQLISNTQSHIHPCAYSFKEPVSPHLAAKLEDRQIDLNKITLPVTDKPLIIEGAGGLLVPLNDSSYAIDLARHMHADVVLVVRNYLGCINHTLLSIDYLMRHNYAVKGLVLNGTFDPEVKKAIVNYADLPVLAEIPELAAINKASVKQCTEFVNLSLFK